MPDTSITTGISGVEYEKHIVYREKHVHVHKNTARRGWISALGVGLTEGAASLAEVQGEDGTDGSEDMGEVRVHVRSGPRVSIPTSLPELELLLHLDKLLPIFISHHPVPTAVCYSIPITPLPLCFLPTRTRRRLAITPRRTN